MRWDICHPTAAAAGGGGRGQQRRTGTGLNRFVVLQDIEDRQAAGTTTLPMPQKTTQADTTTLTRVTAVSTANRYRLPQLMDQLARTTTEHTTLTQIDECVYWQQQQHGGTEVFFFDYGVFVAWAMTEDEEWRLADALRKDVEDEPLDDCHVEVEQLFADFNPAYVPARIYNDRIMLPSAADSQLKLAISHAIAQSAELSFFEHWVERTIADLNHIPKSLARHGKVKMKRASIIKASGVLFNVRNEVNLNSCILDQPEIFWSEPSLSPMYKIARQYLEIDARVDILNHRIQVISNLLDLLNDDLNHLQSESLEWIVIFLISVHIVLGFFHIYSKVTTM